MGKSAMKPADTEFANAMQQLSAEASKNVPAKSPDDGALEEGKALAELRAEVTNMAERLDGWESTITAKLDRMAAAIENARPPDTCEQFRMIADQLTALRGTESVNQRLFDSLHDELLKYRDNFLHESLQKPFIHDLVHLFDDLTKLSQQLQSAAQEQHTRGNLAQWRDNLDNAIHSLVEILHRFEVKEIEPRENVDRTVHKVLSFEPANFPEEDGNIVMRVRRGFLWRGKLIRPEEVIAKRYG